MVRDRDPISRKDAKPDSNAKVITHTDQRGCRGRGPARYRSHH